MISDTDRCNAFQREYPAVGSTPRRFEGYSIYTKNFTLQRVVGGNINVWSEPTVTEADVNVVVAGANVYTNTYNITELRPEPLNPESTSWMAHMCNVLGQMPFMYTCSSRVNVLIIDEKKAG